MSNGFWAGAGQLGRMSRPGPSISRGSYSSYGPRFRWGIFFTVIGSLALYLMVAFFILDRMGLLT